MKVVISGGGTAGHAYPAIALAWALSKRPEAPEILYVGTRQGVESRLAREAGLRFESVDAKGFERSLRGALAAVACTKGYLQSMKLLAVEMPSVVVGMGGFVTVPVLAAARTRGIPMVLHEQNSVPGLANRLFAKSARVVCLTFEVSAERLAGARTLVTGNPVREAITRLEGRAEACVSFGLDPARPVALIFGGSRGAKRINDAVIDALSMWPTAADDVQILHVTGRIEYEQIAARAAARSAAVGPAYFAVPYVDEMERAYACATIVLARAGATTIAEVASAGVPAVLVPYPYATEDHQRLNAEALQEAGAALVVEDEALTPGELIRNVVTLASDQRRLDAMRVAARAWSRPDAADALAGQVMKAARTA